jgi:hypothetical protein
MTWIGSLSCQSFGPQPFQIFAQRDLHLLVFGQRAIRWTEYVVPNFVIPKMGQPRGKEHTGVKSKTAIS